jgi:hypothetical protein
MKKITPLLFLLLIASSCKNTWNREDKDLFYQACTDEAIKWAGTKERAKTYCDCVLQKMEERYPNEQDALDNIITLTKDTGLINCKQQILNQQFVSEKK